MNETVYGAIALALAGADQGAPTDILLMPAGEVRTRPNDRRASWHNTDPAAVVAASRALALDLPIDFDHQTQRSAENGQPAPASGWVKRVYERAGAIYGAVEWTADAARMIAAKQFRFISPVFDYTRIGRRVTRIRGGALTNEPALYMPALARAEGGIMEFLERLRMALGLGADATEDTILAEVQRLHTMQADMKASAAVDRHAAQGRITPAMREPMLALARRDPDGFEALAGNLPVSGESDEARATAAVDRYTAQGRIPPAARGCALALARRDPDGFAAFADALPQLAPGALMPGGLIPPSHSDISGVLTDTERAAARALGITAEQYQESRKALAQARAEGDL